MITDGKKYLITTEDWFRTPDGDQSKAVWGTAKMLTTDDVFSFKPLRPSTNWFLKVGEGNGSMIVAGCQIHYAIECEDRPTVREGTAKDSAGNDRLDDDIYFAE